MEACANQWLQDSARDWDMTPVCMDFVYELPRDRFPWRYGKTIV